MKAWSAIYMRFLLLILLPGFVQAQNCMGTFTSNANPGPVGGVYAPGTEVVICVTVNNYSQAGANWFEGFDITLGAGWVANSITPVTYPTDLGTGGPGGWIWVPGTFNLGGNNFGPGYFFDLDGDGQTGDDFGDMGAGPWTMCIEVTVGSTPGASLSLTISPVGDGFAGSWGSNACDGFFPQNGLPSTTTVSGCTSAPSISITSTTNVLCEGQSTGAIDAVGSGGTGPYTYQLNGATVSMPAQNLAAGNYSVGCIDATGCPSAAVQVAVSENAEVINSIANQQNVLCNGDATGSFDINTVGGQAPYTYTLNGNSNATGVFAGLSNGNYSVTVTDVNNCPSSINVNITQPLPIASSVGSVIDADCAGSADGSCDINAIGGAPPLQYQLGGTTNSNGIFSSLTSGNYTVNVIDNNGCIHPQNVTIGEQSNITTTVPSIINVACFGDATGAISLSASGGATPYSYSLSNSQTNASGSFSNLSAGTYAITIDDANGCTFVVPGLSISEPAAPLTVAPSSPATICEGQSNGVAQSNIAGGTIPYTIVWNNGSNAQNLTNVSAGSYTVNVTDGNGCTASGSASVVETALPIASVGTDGEFCEGFSYALSYTGAAVASYQWQPTAGLSNSNVANPDASPLITTQYTLVVTDDNGCASLPSTPVTVTFHPTPLAPTVNVVGGTTFCEGQTATLSVNGGSTYLWTNGATSNSISVSQTGNFSARRIDIYGCVSPWSAPVNVTVNPLPAEPQISSSGVSSFCDGDDVVLTSVPAAGVTWSNGMSNSPITVANSGQYTATFMDANGCESQPSSPLVLTVIPLAPTPVINADGATTFCFGDSVRLTCSTADTYAWSTGATGNSIVVSSSGTYSVTTTDECPSADMTSELNVFVRPIPEPNIASDTLIDCLPSVLNFSASPTGMGPFNYYWSFGDGSGSTAISPFYEYQNPGTYTIGLTVVDPVGCTGTESIVNKVRILPRAILDYTITPPTVSLSNANVEFSGLAPNSTNASWSISGFNGLDTIPLIGFDTAYAQHTFSDTGLYIVQYTVTTAEGCEASVTDLVRVYEDFDMYVPLSFSPDGDGINDEFFPVLPGFEIEGYEFRIFNRWGRQIFMTYSTDSGWSGDEMPAGYYFWKIEGKSKKNLESIQRDGYLFLVR